MTSQTVWSQLTLVGNYILESPLRIGNGTTGTVLDSEGRPYIPGSTFRGALRAYLESMLRVVHTPQHDTPQTVTLRGSDGRPVSVTRMVTLCCDSVDKRDDDLNYQGCLTKAIVAKWEADPLLRPILAEALVNNSCQVCRLFGASWLAGRVFVADLPVINSEWRGGFHTRGGLTLSRDRDVAIEGSRYERQAVPSGTAFTFQLVAQNVTPAEQGMILLGLRAFESGMVLLGADRARGFGRGHLAIDWWNCRYVDGDHLIDALLGAETQPFTEVEAEARLNAFVAQLGKSYASPHL
ncbi:MAG: RAMP superfamily CRISPR-associated protein [Chloroflexota bacterium]